MVAVLRWITLPSGHAGLNGVTIFSYGRRVGIFLTLVVGIVQAVSALLLFCASGEPRPWASGEAS